MKWWMFPRWQMRQTDLLVKAAQHAKAINIKKGQFVSPWDMRYAVDKVRESGNQNIFLTERGSSFGYNNLVVDMRSLAVMREFAPVVFDATHSVQLPSAGSNDVARSPSSGFVAEPAGGGRATQALRDRRRSKRPTSDKPANDQRPTANDAKLNDAVQRR